MTVVVALSTRSPTAVHDVAEVQDRLVSSTPAEPAGAATAWAVQAVPSQESVVVVCDVPPIGGAWLSASQAVGELQAIALSEAPPASGALWIVHLVPSQTSTSVWSSPGPPG